MVDAKADRIIKLFSKGLDAHAVAREMGYETYTSISKYMRRKGYRWNPKKRNYEREEVIHVENGHDVPQRRPGNGELREEEDDMDGEAVQELFRNARRLLELLRSSDTTEQRLGIKVRQRGIPEVTKGFRMDAELDDRLKRFAARHGVLQKDIIRTALIEFLDSRGEEA